MARKKLTIQEDDTGLFIQSGDKIYRPDFNYCKDTTAHHEMREQRSRLKAKWAIDSDSPTLPLPVIPCGNILGENTATGLSVQHTYADGSYTFLNWSDETLPDIKSHQS